MNADQSTAAAKAAGARGSPATESPMLWATHLTTSEAIAVALRLIEYAAKAYEKELAVL